MAYTQRDFVRDLALWSTATLTGATRQRKFLQYAAKKGIQLAGIGAARAVPAAGRLAMRSPVGVGLGIGAGILATEPGQELLAAAEERGRQDRIRYEMALQELMTTPERIERTLMSAPVSPAQALGIPTRGKRKLSDYNKAVKAGMAAVRKSKFNGKPGKLTNAKRTFAQVAKTASRIKKGKKVSAKGVIGTIARAVRPKLKKGKTKVTLRVKGRDY